MGKAVVWGDGIKGQGWVVTKVVVLFASGFAADTIGKIEVAEKRSGFLLPKVLVKL